VKDIRPNAGAQTKFLSSQADIAVYGGSAGSGKRLNINTLIPTPKGFKRMGELKSGDQVFAIDGSVSSVVNAFPIEFTDEAYDVVFDDGEVINADGEHLWKTMTYEERTQAHRRTEEFRSNRRANRPSRAKELKKNYGASITITRVNQEREYEYLEGSDGSIRTTYDILDTLRIRGTRANHSVSVAEPICLPYNEMLVETYLIGCWLGDGFSGSGKVGCLVDDINEMLTHIKSEVLSSVIETKNRNQPFKVVTFKGFTHYLRVSGLLNNKHIPLEYLRGSFEQRLELLCGMMDTDGTCGMNGKCTIGFSNERLINDTQQLLGSLGIKCAISEKKFDNPNHKTHYSIHFVAPFHVFHLSRKKERQIFRSVNSERRYIVDVRKAESCFMRCIEIDHPSHLYLVGETFIPTHNSFALLMEAARHIHVPGYGAVIFRRESRQITAEGGLRDTAMNIYPMMGGQYRAQPTPHFIFPAGTKISFSHLNQESDCIGWDGTQICFIGFDEAIHFTDFQITYLLSRNRSLCGVKPLVRMTSNPDSESWLAVFLSWWIDQETGFPIKERSGKIRYMVRYNGDRVWADSREELVDLYGCEYEDAKSVTFVPALITDNPILLQRDPAYLGNLKALSRVERARLLDGNWKVRAIAGMYFPRFDAKIIDWLPQPGEMVKWIRSWDLAASEESEGKDPDWSVGMLVGRKENGKLVIGDVIRVRRKAAEIRSLVKNMAVKDGKDVWINLPRDPGQAGKFQAESFLEMLHGFTVISRSITKNKVTMAEPAAALWQQGNIEMVRAAWNEEVLAELESFPEGKHDDLVDALAGATNGLPGHSKPDYSNSGLSGRFKPIRQSRSR